MRRINLIALVLVYSNFFGQNIRVTNNPTYNLVPINTSDLPDPIIVNRSLVVNQKDDFNSTQLNTNMWQVGFGWGTTVNDNVTGGWENQCWANPGDVKFPGSGIMQLGNNYNPTSTAWIWGTSGPVYFQRDYSVGAISSVNKYGYGYYEMRCKLPAVNAMWPSFWLRGDSDQEIDVFEFNDESFKSQGQFGPNGIDCHPYVPRWYEPVEFASSSPYLTWHSPGAMGSQKTAFGIRYEYGDWKVVETPLDNFSHGCDYEFNTYNNFHYYWHTFGLLFDPLKIVWYIDGSPVRADARYMYFYLDMTHLPHSYKFYPILSTADYDVNNLPFAVRFSPDRKLVDQRNFPVGDIPMTVEIGNARTMPPLYNHYDYVTNWANWPESFLEVDYFSYSHFDDCSGTLKYCQFNDVNNKFPQNLVKANEIYLGTDNLGSTTCSFVKPVASSLDLVAFSEIGLINDFQAAVNGEFSARIGQCTGGDLQRASTASDSILHQLAINSANQMHKGVQGTNDKLPIVAHNFKVYPNPSDRIIKIEFTGTERPGLIAVEDLLGNQLLKILAPADNQEVNMEGLAPGVYIIRCAYSDQDQTAKLIKQ